MDPVSAPASPRPPLDAAHRRAQAVSAQVAPAESRALGVLAILAILAVVSVVIPVGAGLLVGAMLAFTASGQYRRMVDRTRRPVLVAAGMAAGATLVVAATLGVIGYLLILKGVAIVAASTQSLSSGGPSEAIVQRLSGPLSHLHVDPRAVADKIRGVLGNVENSMASWAGQIVAVVADGALGLFFMATTMYVVLRRGTALTRRAERLVPLNPHHTRRLMRELQRLGRAILIGNFGTALVQGVLASIGFLIAGAPQPAFLGAITAVASFIPAFGTMLVWVPVGVVLIANGSTASGILELAWGAVIVVGIADYFVRPRLIGRGESMSTWMTFVALFGGIKLFGVIGFLFGPLLVGFALAALRLYERARRFRLGTS